MHHRRAIQRRFMQMSMDSGMKSMLQGKGRFVHQVCNAPDPQLYSIRRVGETKGQRLMALAVLCTFITGQSYISSQGWMVLGGRRGRPGAVDRLFSLILYQRQDAA